MPLTNTCAVTLISLKKFTLEVKLRCRFSLDKKKISTKNSLKCTKKEESV